MLFNRKYAVAFAMHVAFGRTSSLSIPPAATGVPTDTGAAAALFEAETVQLTDSTVQKIDTQINLPTSYADLFGFEDVQSSEVAKRTLQKGACKVFPGDRSWPTDRLWDVFNFLTGGALIPTVPIAASCYQGWNSFSQEKCDAVIKGFGTTELHEADPTSMMWPIFQGRTCLPADGLKSNATCTIGGYPEYVVQVENVAQIQLAVNFARNTNMRLVIKNTGHCYLGKSGGAGSLSLWMHHLRDIEFLSKYKSQEYSGPAMKVGAGVLVREVFLEAEKHGMTAVGGICPNVGFTGGYVAGGGHSALSSLLGMAADQVLAFEVVTADGRFITASSTKNSDLFWALRGGGGSTYGIVTSAVIKVHPKIPVTTSRFTISTSETVSNETFWTAVHSFYENFPRFTNAGAYVYFFITNTNGVYALQIIPFFAPNHTPEQLNKLAEPWFARLRALNIPFTPDTKQHASFYPAYDSNFGDDNPIGSTTVMPGNRLFPRQNFENPAKLNATVAAIRETSEQGYLTIGFAMAPGNPQKVDNSVSSAFRNAMSLHITNVMIPENSTPEQVKAGSDTLLGVLGRWREAAPESEGGGSYLNEAHVMDPNWTRSFYGDQYQRLKEIKEKWDPRDVFYATTAVGSEDWEIRDGFSGVKTQNGKLCKV